MTEQSLAVDPRRRRQARRTALLLGLLAFGLYVAFIAFALRHGHS